MMPPINHDPKDGNVTLLTLQRAADMIGRRAHPELAWPVGRQVSAMAPR